MSVDWQSIRAQFPAVQDQVYLNTATYGPGPDCVRNDVQEALDAWSQGRGNWLDWEQDAEEARSLFAKLVETETSNVALLPTLSVAAGQVAEGLVLTPRANIVVGESEFRSNLFPWLAQERRGFEVRLVPFRDGRLDLADLLQAIDQRTALTAVSHVQSLNGFRLPLAELAEHCSKNQSRLFVDGSQSVGALRVRADCVDYLAVSAYKWLLGPRGGCFLTVKPERLEEPSPVVSGWKTVADPYQNYYGPPFELAPDASRFDTSLAWLPWVGLRSSLNLLISIGIAEIEARNLSLAKSFRERLPELGLTSLFSEDESSQIIGLKIPHPEAVAQALKKARIVAAVRGDYLRAAFHFFNDQADVDTTLAALEQANQQLQG